MKLSKTFTLTTLFCIAHSLPAVIDSEISVTGKDGTHQDLSALQVEAEIHTESNSRDFIRHSRGPVNTGKRFQVPNSPGQASMYLATITIKVIVNTANQLLWEIINDGPDTRQVQIRELNTIISAAIIDVASHHKVAYDTLGGILPGDVVNIVNNPV